MLGVLAANRARSATACDFCGRAECRNLAIEIHRHIERIRLRIERHRAPTLEASCTRAETDLHAQLRNHPGPIRHLARLIDVEDVLIAKIGGADERAGLPIELPENPELAHLEQR